LSKKPSKQKNVLHVAEAAIAKQYKIAENAAWNTYYIAAMTANVSYLTGYQQITRQLH